MAIQGSDPVALSAYLNKREGRPAEIRETHISWVFLTASRAYKLKKPLLLPFLDYSSPEQRKQMCSEELRLNRRLAPDVYLAVQSVIPQPDGVALSHLHDPNAIDYVVEMRRYREADTLAALLRGDEATADDLRRVGRCLAEFHAECPQRVRRSSAARATEREVDRNVVELLDLVEDTQARTQIRGVWRSLTSGIGSRATELNERAGRGLVREVHGDVRAEHVLLSDSVEIVDCLEFDPELRTLDVADEIGFLVMELIEASAQNLVAPLLEGYRQAGGDCGEDSLVALFAVHRALVRAKVGCVAAGEEAAKPRPELPHRTQRLLRMAERMSWMARLPAILVMCGLPASGKSHLAEHLRKLSGLPVIGSDLTRKELVGVASTERAAPAHYTPGYNRQTYAELGRQASLATAQAGSVLVDATFRHKEDRRAFMAEIGDHSCVLVECVAPAEVLRHRSLSREQDPARVSDADAHVVERLLEDWAPLDEIAPENHLMLRSDRPVDRVIADLAALLDDRLLDCA